MQELKMQNILKRLNGRLRISGPEFELELTPDQEDKLRTQGISVPDIDGGAIAIGAGAHAVGNGVAVGAGAYAGPNSVSIGAGAGGRAPRK